MALHVFSEAVYVSVFPSVWANGSHVDRKSHVLDAQPCKSLRSSQWNVDITKKNIPKLAPNRTLSLRRGYSLVINCSHRSSTRCGMPVCCPALLSLPLPNPPESWLSALSDAKPQCALANKARAHRASLPQLSRPQSWPVFFSFSLSADKTWPSMEGVFLEKRV